MNPGRKSKPWEKAATSRAPRETETRETEARSASWQQASALPEPDPRPGFVHRWVRVSMFGVDDVTNFSKKRREQWEPCQTTEYPEFARDMTFSESKYAQNGLIEIGGLVLCRMPEEIANERNRYWREYNQRQLDGVDSKYLANRDSRTGMKAMASRSTRVSFGSEH